MSWRDLLGGTEILTLPWVGGRKIYSKERSWALTRPLPRLFGWYEFEVNGGREAKLIRPADPDPYFKAVTRELRGYLVGDRLIQDDVRVVLDPDKLIQQTQPVLLVEDGMDRFTRAVVGEVLHETGSRLIYLRQEFPQGPEDAVLIAYQDKETSLAKIKGVTPSLELAFTWLTQQRLLAEKRVEEETARRALEARRQQMVTAMGSGAGRRELAQRDFKTAAQAALAISGSELLDCRPGRNQTEMIVQYRVGQRRLECVIDKATLGVLDAGVCLTDPRTGIKGDTFYTLESLPSVIKEALALNKLVVWRHVPGDQDHQVYNHDEDEDDDY